MTAFSPAPAAFDPSRDSWPEAWADAAAVQRAGPLLAALQDGAWPPGGWQGRWVAQTTSTSTVLMQAPWPDPQGTAPAARLLVADSQSDGRGRRGRTWRSAPGDGLMVSLDVPLQREDLSGLSLAVGLALWQALQGLLPPAAARRLALKWPNDLAVRPPRGETLPGGRLADKLGGILIEASRFQGQRRCVIGFGLNLRSQPQAQNDPVRYASGHAALDDLAPPASAEVWLQRLLPPLAQALARFDAAGWAPLRSIYAQADLLQGQEVGQVDEAGVWRLLGVAQGVDDSGALLLQGPDGPLRQISGEMSVRPRPA
ncbi:biotin--[acetyl-CoA-carboxylase] ligase [Amphibiibacter pelophylacis]|uniref:Biotin--[acetyl-CoA-carboxylase] ligase n=1 Tax=Amphibiibacter pelophylacis TaxID=1799477 RepID=A0ACC6P5M0_9BURK